MVGHDNQTQGMRVAGTGRGKFITLEGGEGVGKSTNLATVEALLRNRGVDLCVTREPGGTVLGEAIRELLLSNGGGAPLPKAELLLIFAARAQHIEAVIEPALLAGQWVLCDRFTDATYAYQGYARRLPLDVIEALEKLVQGDLRPDLTVLLDLPPAVGLERASQRAQLDRFEQESQAFFERVRQGYLERAQRDPKRWLLVDAAQPLQQVQAELSASLDQWLACHVN
jgi:dTMP kinase